MQVFYQFIIEDQVGWGPVNGHKVRMIFTKVIYDYHRLGCDKSISPIVIMIILPRWDDDATINLPYVKICKSKIRSMIYSFRWWILTWRLVGCVLSLTRSNVTDIDLVVVNLSRLSSIFVQDVIVWSKWDIWSNWNDTSVARREWWNWIVMLYTFLVMITYENTSLAKR